MFSWSKDSQFFFLHDGNKRDAASVIVIGALLSLTLLLICEETEAGQIWQRLASRDQALTRATEPALSYAGLPIISLIS